MRISEDHCNIEYQSTKEFFENRALKYNIQNPYSVTMFQDNNPELVKKRNAYETEKLIGKMHMNQNSIVLDLACGVGRWADALNGIIGSYLGVDFSDELITIAKMRNNNPNVQYVNGSITELDKMLKKEQRFNRVLIIGALVYLNDDDVYSLMKQVVKHCEHSTIICIREPIGIENRLTLKDYFSDELQDNYNAIYRTRNEIIQLITPLIINGFSIIEEDFLFADGQLNNRSETAQYFFILKR